MKALYMIDSKPYLLHDEGLEQALESAYENKKRPLCNCTTPPVEMYIAKINSKYVIKRMPETGGKHDPDCGSYELPIELSGLGQVAGTAIQENIEDGLTTLKLDFSLSKGASRAAPVASGIEHDSVSTDGNKLSLRATLHYLWEQAEFNKWTPAMRGKRSWYIIRKYLLEAAHNKSAKGRSLDAMLFIPESFSLERKEEITKRRIAKLAYLNGTGSQKPLMLAIGEVKELDKARFDFKMVIKHLPDMHIMLNEDIYKRLLKRFEVELELWRGDENSHLLFIGTFGVSQSGTASFQELALMMVNENWIPYENKSEQKLIETLTKKNARFIKSLRYNLPSTKPLATALLTDDDKKTTALYIRPAMATESYIDDLQAILDSSEFNSWVWDAGSEDVPTLPLNTREQHE